MGDNQVTLEMSQIGKDHRLLIVCTLTKQELYLHRGKWTRCCLLTEDGIPLLLDSVFALNGCKIRCFSLFTCPDAAKLAYRFRIQYFFIWNRRTTSMFNLQHLQGQLAPRGG